MAPVPPAPFLPAAPPDLLRAALEIALTGFILLRPRYDPADPATIADLAYEYVNPAAQRMLHLPERPAESFLTLYPNTVATGVFAFYRDTFLAGGTGRYDVNYQHDGLDNYYQLVGRRCGDWLLVSFSDTADQPRTAVEVALRDSQAREQAALAEADADRQRLRDILTQLPAQVAVNRGPAHVYELVNPRYQQLFPARAIQGLPVREALPELEGQEFYELLDQVYQTGEPFYGHEMPAAVDYAGSGRMEQRYFNVFFQALRDAQGRIDGLLNFAYDVTDQVMARREVEQLNQELEARVFERTQALRYAQAEAEAAAQRLLRVTDSLPSTSFTTDATGQVLYVSPQWYAYTGMVPGADVNETWPGLIHPDDLPTIAQEFGAALAEGRAWRYELRVRGADGTYRWFTSQGQPEPLAEAEAAGRPRQWFGSNLDIDDLKQAQHALEQQERRLSQILAQSPAMIATLTGPEHRYSFTNPGYDALVEHRAKLGRSVAECLPEVVEQGFIELLDAVYQTGQPYQGRETPIVLQLSGPAPATYFLDFTYQPLRDEQGRITRLLFFVLDVTERVHTRQRAETLQAELLATAQRQVQERTAFHEIFEQTTALVALLRAPGHRYEYVNPAYQALFAGRQLVGLDVAVAVPEMREQGFVAVLDQVYQTGVTQHATDVPFVLAPAPGQPARTAYYNITYQAYREAGQVAGLSIFAYDVTEQVLARRERDAQRQQLQDLFEQVPVAISILRGADYVVEVANPLVARLWGRPPADLLGRPVFEALPEARDQGFQELLDGVRQSGEAFVAEEVPAQLLRGDTVQTVYLNYVYQPLRDADGAITGVAAVGTDVTAQVQDRQRVQELNDQLAALNGQLAASNAGLAAANQQLTRTNVDLDTFIYTASHDLKAPITNIEGLLATLRDELPAQSQGPAGEVPYILDLMQDSVERFKHTIDHLTDISKLQKEYDGQQPAQPVPLADVIEGVRLDLAPLLQQTGGRLDVDVRAVPALTFSEKSLRSVVFNLLSNALKYRHPDRAPRVRVRARLEEGFAVLEVQDNGLGFDVGREAQLFAMFQRLHTHVEGSGVGLYMVKRLVENAGGTIAVASTVGEGTTFTVSLPL